MPRQGRAIGIERWRTCRLTTPGGGFDERRHVATTASEVVDERDPRGEVVILALRRLVARIPARVLPAPYWVKITEPPPGMLYGV